MERSRFQQGGLEGVRIRRGRSVRASRGFTFIEVLVVIIIFGLLVAIVGPVAGKWIRRSEDMAALASARQVLAVARLQAVKRSANVVVEIGYVSVSPSDKRIRFHTFQDRANDTTSPLPGSSTTPPTDEALAAGNCIQDIGKFITSPATDEPTLGLGIEGQSLTQPPAPGPPPADVILSPRIHFWKQGGSQDDVADAVRFDKYLDTPGSGNTTCGSSTDRIIFLPTGGISVPQDPGSGPNPASPTTNERGIYFADWQGKNYFRVTVESDLSGKARVDKYVQGLGYVTSGWQWQ